MTPRQKKVSWFIAAVIVVAGLVIWLVVTALNKDGGMNFSFTPTDVYNKKVPQGRSFRIGGLVVANSLKRESDGLTVHFEVTDTFRTIPVIFKGILPDLFKEGKGVVAQGKMGADNIFHADEVLAKHDENYMPPDAKNALDKAAKAEAAAKLASPVVAASAVK